MCVYIVQYYAINLMFNSDGVAALLCGEAKERLLQAPALPLPLFCLKSQAYPPWESLDLRAALSHSIPPFLLLSFLSQSSSAFSSWQ